MATFDFDNGETVTKNLGNIKQFISVAITNKKYNTIKYNMQNAPTTSNTGASTFIPVNTSDNVYFIFDKNMKMRYIGKKETMGINERLKLHLIQNNTSTSSCINEVISEIKKGIDEFNYFSIKVLPQCMSPAVESYFIDDYRSLNPAECDFVKRK